MKWVPVFIILVIAVIIPGASYLSSENQGDIPGPFVYDYEEKLIMEHQAQEGLRPITEDDYKKNWAYKKKNRKRVLPPKFDFNQNIDTLTIEQLRLKRFEVYARKSYPFSDKTLSSYYEQFDWYWPLYQYNGGFDYSLTKKEQKFYDKVKKIELKLLKKRSKVSKKDRKPQFNEIANISQYKRIDPVLKDRLNQYGFAVIKSKYHELYHIYEQNDYDAIPSFITTDIYLQLYHVYFSYLLRNLEMDEFFPIIRDMCYEMYMASKKIAGQKTKNKLLKDAAEFNMLYYAVPYYFMTKQKLELPKKLQKEFEKKVRLIEEAKQIIYQSPLFDDTRIIYSLFKPRGNYTRNAKLGAYFKAMMWLQHIGFKVEHQHHMARIMLSAALLNTVRNSNGKLMKDEYLAFYEPTGLLMGNADNLSVLDLIKVMKKFRISNQPSKCITQKNIEKIIPELDKLNPDRINRKIMTPASGKWQFDSTTTLNFMPQRYNPDAEIIQRIVNITDGPGRREFPKGLDILAAFGNQYAENILINECKENDKWPAYSDTLHNIQNSLKDYDFGNSIYDKWISILNSLFEINEVYPYFMHEQEWQRKNLITALGSWAELKHDAVLYGEQLCIAECGSGGPYHSPDLLVGYVEPNIIFWENCINLLELTKNVLKKHDIYNKYFEMRTEKMLEFAEFLRAISVKEIYNNPINPIEFETIKIFGSTLEYFHEQLNTDDGWIKDYNPADSIWGWDMGYKEEELPTVTDVYTLNNKCLEIGVGKANTIFVIVEIGGYWYLARGGVFSYYEFTQPQSDRMTDEAWRLMLDEGKEPDYPDWMKGIIIETKGTDTLHYNSLPYEINSRYTYSSGC